MSYPIPKIQYGDSDTEVVFDFPPAQDDGEELDAQETVTTSISGVNQVSVNYIEAVRPMNFTFLTKAIRDAMEIFYSNHALFGRVFKYFEDQSLNEFVYYELKEYKFKPKRITGKQKYPYEIPVNFRRVLGFIEGDNQVISILNDQSVAVDLAGVIFDKTEFSSATIIGELRRRVDGTELVSSLELICQYREPTDDWIITQGPDVSENPIGVTFSITAWGQVQYTSSNMAGTNYVGVYKIKQSKFSA